MRQEDRSPRYLRWYGEDDAGTTAIIFAICMIFICGTVGGAIDFGRSFHTKAVLQNAADSAVLAAAKVLNEGGSRDAAEAAALTVFTENKDSAKFGVASSKVFFPSNDEIALDVTASVATTLLNVLGFRTLPVSVHAQALAGVREHADLHILVDGTGSMNIPDSKADIRRFSALFRPYGGAENCSFACHLAGSPVAGQPGTYNGKTGFEIARENNIYLREDRIREAVAGMITTISQTEGFSRIRATIQSFGWTTEEVSPLTGSFVSLRDGALSLTNRSRGTNVSYMLNLYGATLNAGTGSASEPKNKVILITDGVDQNATSSGPGRFDPAACTAIKQKGIEIIVLNVVYPDPNDLEGSASKVNEYRDTISEAPGLLEQCASPNRYFKANEGAEIEVAMRDIGSLVSTSRTPVLTR